MNTKFYSDDEFINKVKDKAGNIRYFRKILRDHGLLEPREKLNDKHIVIFNRIKAYKSTTNCTWEHAINEEVKAIVAGGATRNIESENNALLREILSRIAGIEKHLGVEDDKVEYYEGKNYPKNNEGELELFKLMIRNRDEVHVSELYEVLADIFNLSEEDRNRKTRSGNETKWANNVRWYMQGLKNKGLVLSDRKGYWKLTPMSIILLEKQIGYEGIYLATQNNTIKELL